MFYLTNRVQVSNHALDRYRLRVGRKRADRSKLVKSIKKEIISAVEEGHYKPIAQTDMLGRRKYLVKTEKFCAVCTHKVVYTIYEKDGIHSPN